MSVIALRRLQALSGPAIAAIAVVLCGWFGSRALAAWRPAEVRAVRAEPAVHSATAVTAAPRHVASAPDRAALVTRNMFCSSCVPAAELEPGPAPAGGVAHTLPRVIATHVGAAGDGWATLEIGGMAGGFTIGATLPGGGVIERIERGAIIVAFADGAERVPLATDGELAGAAGATKQPGTGEPAQRAKTDPWADRIRVVGERRWEVDRTLIRELVQAGTSGNPAARGVRLQPVSKDGKLAGVRVTASRTGSLSAALGLATGDVIETIDGQPIDSPQVLMKMYDRLADLRRVDLGIRRKNAAVTLTYDLP